LTFTDNGLSLGRKRGGSACSSVGGGEFAKDSSLVSLSATGNGWHERVAEEQQPLGKRYSWRLPCAFRNGEFIQQIGMKNDS